MKRFVGILTIFFVITIFCCCLVNNSNCKVFVNGSDIGVYAVIKDNIPYLSIEDMGTICLAHETIFNKEQEKAEVKLFDTICTFYADQTEYLTTYDDVHIEHNQLTSAAFIEKNTLYLTVDLLTQLYYAEIDWQNTDNKLSINFAVSYGAFGSEGQIYCRAVRYGVPHEPTLSQDHLVVYYPNGLKALLARGWHIDEIKIDCGVCYFLVMQHGFGEQLHLYAVDLQTRKMIQLGDTDFVYARPIIEDVPGFYVLGGQDDMTYDWHIEEDGIYIVGFSQKALGDDFVEDIDLAEQTYGIWCVDKQGNGQRLVQELSFD